MFVCLLCQNKMRVGASVNIITRYIMEKVRILSNFLLRQPKIISRWRHGIPIVPLRLDSVSAGLTRNLLQSCNSYVEGIVDLDKQFLKNTTSPYLFNKIEAQIDQIKSQSTNPQQQLINKLGIDTREPSPQSTDTSQPTNLKKFQMVIYPYVVFGSTVPQRIVSHPLQNVIQLTRNRYFRYKKPSQGLGQYFRSLWNQQVYGFKCEMFTDEKLGRNLIITFEGNIDTHQYFVVDLNNQLINNEYKSANK